MTPRTRNALEISRRLPAPPPINPDKVSVLVLASGSKGNCLLVTAGDRAVMVDAGISPKAAFGTAAVLGFSLVKLDGLLLTHAHSDHAEFATKMAMEYHCNAYATSGSWAMIDPKPPHSRHINAFLSDDAWLDLPNDSPFSLQPIEVQHDCPGTVAYLIRAGRKMVMVAHDLGMIPSYLLAACREADVVCIEANYEPELLAQSRYDDNLRARISSPVGHLANEQALRIIDGCRPQRLQALVILHVSEETNDRHEVEGRFRAALQAKGFKTDVLVARQDAGISVNVNGAPVIPVDEPRNYRQRAAAINSEVDSLIAQENAGREESQRRHVRIAAMVTEMYELFEGKNPTEELAGFPNYTQWAQAKAAALRISKRELSYCKLVGDHLLPNLSQDEAASIPIVSAQSLALYVKHKGDLPGDLVDYAKEHTANSTKSEVFARLNENGDMHFDSGPRDRLIFTSSVNRMKPIKEAIERLKPKCGTNDELEILEAALIALEAEKDLEAKHEAETIAFPDSLPPDVADWSEVLAESAIGADVHRSNSKPLDAIGIEPGGVGKVTLP